MVEVLRRVRGADVLGAGDQVRVAPRVQRGGEPGLGRGAAVGQAGGELADRPDEQFDAILDGAGGDVQEICLGVLAAMGRLVSYNGVGGTVNVNKLRMNAQTVVGFAMPHFVAHRPDLYARQGERLWELAAGGLLRPAVHDLLSLDRAGDAHRVIQARANLGKVLLDPAE